MKSISFTYIGTNDTAWLELIVSCTSKTQVKKNLTSPLSWSIQSHLHQLYFAFPFKRDQVGMGWLTDSQLNADLTQELHNFDGILKTLLIWKYFGFFLKYVRFCGGGFFKKTFHCKNTQSRQLRQQIFDLALENLGWLL